MIFLFLWLSAMCCALQVHPNVRCFSSVIKAHAKAGEIEKMERRFRQLMASPGNRPDLEIFITVIRVWISATSA